MIHQSAQQQQPGKKSGGLIKNIVPNLVPTQEGKRRSELGSFAPGSKTGKNRGRVDLVGHISGEEDKRCYSVEDQKDCKTTSRGSNADCREISVMFSCR